MFPTLQQNPQTTARFVLRLKAEPEKLGTRK